ncbi:unnamed protein product [Closterium sp. Yama58-4]|nr:unnamed protein product [Closterium sp. Yama58-4]
MAALTNCSASSVRAAGLGVATPSKLSSASCTSSTSLALRPRQDASRTAGRQHSRLVVEAKGKKNNQYARRLQQQQPSVPEFDPSDDTPRFVLFIKTKAVNRWYPLSVVTGGTAAKMMLAVMRNDLGKKLYEGTLTRNIAAVVYKDEKALRNAALRQYPMLKGASGYDYGYKVMDPANPRAAMYGSDVVKMPPEAELKSVFDKAKEFVDDKFGNAKEAFGKLSSIGSLSPPEEAPKASDANKSAPK